ncbi:MAG: bifunctional riboflavin kinase/FMN adenylyltransferase [Terriglobales bacterium]
MQVFHKLADIPADFGPSIVAVGNFDGVHRAHRAVLSQIVERAQATHAVSVCVTFEPHPTRILRPDANFKLLTPTPEKLRLLAQTSVDAVLLIPFSRDLSLMTPHQFAHDILKKHLHAREVHEGYNFRFGRGASGTVEVLRELGREMGFAVHDYPEMRLRGERVSSSHIRKLLSEGNVSRARHLLGRPFSILSFAGRGRGYGAKYTVPTINLAHYEELVPKDGVYITRTRIASGQAISGQIGSSQVSGSQSSNNPNSDPSNRELAQSKAGSESTNEVQNDFCFDSVTNVGNRPTFGPDSFAIETHLLNFRPIELSADTEVELHFLDRLRDEVKFPSIEALKAQISRDVQKAQKYLRRLGRHWPNNR